MVRMIKSLMLVLCLCSISLGYGTYSTDRMRTAIEPDFNVKHPTYDAKGDSETDDTAAIQAAIDAADAAGGGTVYFPSGTYNVASTLQLRPKVNLIGNQVRTAKIDYTGTGHVFSASEERVYYFIISDLSIDGNGNTNGDCINITNTDSASYNSRITLQRLRIEAAGANGIRLAHVHTSQINNVVIAGCGTNGIYLDTDTYSLTSISIEDVWVNTLAAGHGVYVAGDQAINTLNLRQVYTEAITGDGFHVATNATVHSAICINGFTADNITGNGIKIIATSYVKVDSSLFLTVSGDGIHIDSGNLSVINCRFVSITGDDIDFGSAYATVIGCEPQDSLVFDNGSGSVRPVFHDWNTTISTVKTSNYTILASDHLRHFNNSGASGTVNFTLPTIETALIGFEVTIGRATTGQVITITPEASDAILPTRLGNGTAIANISNRAGDTITLKAVNVTTWHIVSQVGLWGITPASVGVLPAFADVDATPSVRGSDIWLTGTATETITDLDNGTIGQILHLISKAAITYDTTGTDLTGSSVDIITASGDTTMWICEDGTTWHLLSWIDISADNS